MLQVILLVMGCCAMNAAENRSPNVVFFLVDDLGWSDLGCYGSTFHETPHIDTFAAEAVRFTQAYATCHVCSPTRASIMTGKYPARLGLTDWLPGRKNFPFQRLKNVESIQQLPFEEITIAEALKQRGYRTGHFGKWHLGEEPSGPLRHGFDVQVPRWNKGWPNGGYHAPFKLEGLQDKPGDYLTDRLTDEALKFMEQNRDSSFFLYLSHFSVHDPIQGRQDLVTKYEAKRESLPARADHPFVLEGNPDKEQTPSSTALTELLEGDEHEGYRVFPDRTVKIKQDQDNAQFAAMVESTDESFGRVIEKLESLGLSETTIVIFFSDNGGMSAANFGNPKRIVDPTRLDRAYSTSNLPLRAGKGWLYEGGIREPMLVKWPGRSKDGPRRDVPVISTDFFPSIMEMIGVRSESPSGIDGQSFVPLLSGEGRLNREAIYWHFPHYSNHGMQSPGGAVRAGDYKLHDYFEKGSVQLFNLRDDIGEQNNLASGHPEKVAELKSLLHTWRAEVGAKMMEPNPAYVPSP